MAHPLLVYQDMAPSKSKDRDEIPDLPIIGADDEHTDASVRRLLKDMFPQPTDPLTAGLQKGEDYKFAKLYFPNDEHDEREVTAYHALTEAARRKFMSNFFVEIEVADAKGSVKRFYVSEYDAQRAEKFGARRI